MKPTVHIDIKHIATLANIPLRPDEEQPLSEALAKTLTVVDELAKLSLTDIEPTSQVTGLENILREDEIDTDRMFSQEEALANAPRQHNGFFVVKAVFDQ